LIRASFCSPSVHKHNAAFLKQGIFDSSLL
jgi:hypothetical protein